MSRWNRTSVHDVATTLGRLEFAVGKHGGIHRIARVDQAQVALTGGARVAPAEVLIIENPALVAQLASTNLELLIDLPIRVLAWQAPSGVTRVRTMPPPEIGAGSEHPRVQQVRQAIDTILGAWLDYAVSDATTIDLNVGGHGAPETRRGDDTDANRHDFSARELAAQFHPNFSSGRIDDNGDLVADDIVANSNGVLVQGRNAFVERLRRYNTPFPGLQLRDRIIIEDGRSAAILYALQGKHMGPFAGRDATGAIVEAFSGEIFDFNEQGKLTHLLTVTHLGHLKDQVHSRRELTDHQDVTYLSPTPVSAEVSESIAAAARSLYDIEIDEAVSSAVDDETTVILDGALEYGPKPLQTRLDMWRTALPDLAISIERTLREGNRVAVSLTARGTHSGPYDTGHGESIAATGRTVEFCTIDFLEFDEAGRLTEIVSVYNTHDISDQIA